MPTALATLLVLSLTTAPAPEVRADAARRLGQAVRAVRSEACELTPEQRVEWLRREARAAAEVLGASSLNAARLGAIAAAPADSRSLEREVARIAADLTFEPRVESPRPQGFPAATPVGEIAVLDHPACRLARVPMSRGLMPTNGAFWKLFRHIESHRIPMTAPVEMTYTPGGRAEAMAFLYASTDVGRAGPDGEVVVADVAPVRVASIGLRGRRTDARVDEARDALRAWLRGQPALEEAGPLRVMAWNSPMVPEAQSYFEVQIPVRERAPAAPAVAER